MFDPRSRYASIADAEIAVTSADGEVRTIRFKRRRLLAVPDDATTIAEHRVRQGERIDSIAAIYVGDATQAWRICDSNLVFRPDELETPGVVVRIGFTLR